MKRLLIQKLMLVSGSLFFSHMTLANAPWSEDRNWLLGDWQGQRQQLEHQGYKFNVAFQNETATNLSGGYNDDRELLHASQLSFAAQFDLNKIANWENTQASINITKRDGYGLSQERLSDPRAGQFSNVQEIYGRGQSWRLAQAWIKTSLDDQRLQLKFGRMGVSEDFNGSHCEFQNLMLCGGQLGKTVGNIWFNGPVTQWAANMKYKFAPDWSIAAGIYEMNPENATEKGGFNLDLDQAEGMLIPVELAWTPQFGAAKNLNGEYKVGAFYSTSDVADVRSDANGNIALKADDLKIHHHKHSIWLNAQQKLIANPQDAKRGLYGTVNLTFNDKATTVVETSQQLAFWYKGPSDRRPNDSIGLGFARFDVNDRAKERRVYTNEVNGLDYQVNQQDYFNPLYRPIQHDEFNVELNYNFQWSAAILLRPNLQYVHNVGGVKHIKDPWVLGLTTRLSF